MSRPGLFENTTLEFSPGVNLVFGKNGSGKSLLARAMIDCLWNAPTAIPILSEKTWDSLYCDIIFSIQSEKQFKAVKNKKSETAFYTIDEGMSVLLSTPSSGTEGMQEQRAEANQEINWLLNRISGETMLESSFLPSPSDIGPKNTVIFSVIKNLLLSDTSGYYSLYNKLILKKEKTDPNKGLAQKISKQELKLKEIIKNIKIIDIQNSRKEKLISEKKNVQKEIDEMSRSLKSSQDRKEKLIEIRKNFEKIEKLNEELKKIKNEVDAEQEKISEISRMKKEITEKFPEFNGLEIENGEELDHLQEIFIEVRNVNEKIDSFYNKKDRLKKITRKIALTISTVFFTLLGALIYTGSITLPEATNIIGASIGAMAVLSLAIISYPYIISGAKTIEALKENKRILGLKMKEYADKIQIHHAKYSLGELYEFLLQYFEDYIEYSDRNREIIDLNLSLKDKAYLDKIQTKLKELKYEEESIKKIITSTSSFLGLDKTKETNFNSLDDLIDDTESKITSTMESINAKGKILSQIDDEIAQNPDNTQGLEKLLAEKKELESVLDRLYSKQNAMSYFVDLLSNTIARSEEKQLKKLVNLAYERFNLLTENQYISQVDEKQLETFFSDEINTDEFNPNLIHFIMLSLKLSLTDFLAASGLNLPLILDDPFLFMDDEKIKNLKELILDISEKRQVIIFTHKKDTADWGNYLEL